jgi:Coenzyme PQQ synthesis protein D (PqqD)
MIPRQAPHVSVKEIDGQLLVLDRTQGQLHELNATASYVWQRCDGHTDMAGIAAALAEAFDIDPATAARDVATILRQFETCRLVEWGTPLP